MLRESLESLVLQLPKEKTQEEDLMNYLFWFLLLLAVTQEIY